MFPIHNTERVSKSFAVFLIAICSIGIIGNILSIIICFRKRLRKIPTFVLLGFKAGTNILSLTAIGLAALFLEFLKFDLTKYNDGICKTSFFLMFWGLQSSVYMRVRKYCVYLTSF
jgi:hypothetical protein